MSSIFEARLEMRKLAEDWRRWSTRIASAARKVLGGCDVYVFGSTAQGRSVGASDVDVLVVAEELPGRTGEMGDLKARIEDVAGLPLYHPYEIHLTTIREAASNSVYREAIAQGVKVRRGAKTRNSG